MYSQTSPALRWRKSSHSDPDGPACVEVASTGAAVAVRDSKDPDGPTLSFSRNDFAAFVSATKRR